MKKTFRFIFALLAVIIGTATMTGPLTAIVYAEEKPAIALAIPNPGHQVAMTFSRNTSPVDTVIGASEILGFNPKADTFTIISETPSLAVVRVVHNGISFNVTLEPSFGGSWTISTMHSSI